MTNAITTTQPGGALAGTQPAGFLGYEDYDGTEFRLPRYSIVQTAMQMTEWGAKGGQFHNSISSENKDELNVVVLAVKKAQWYGPDFDEATKLKAAGQEVKPYCKSSNGKSPDSDVEKPQAQLCALCPHFKGKRNAHGDFEPPACTKIRKLLLAEDDGTIAMLTVRKGSAQEVDNFVQPFSLRKAPLMSVRATVKTVAKKDARNQWYVPDVKAHFDQPVDQEEQLRLGELASLYLNFVNQVDEADTHGDEQAANPTGGGHAPIDVPAMPPEPETPAEIPPADQLGF